MKPEVDIFKNTQFYPMEGWSFNSKSNVALGPLTKTKDLNLNKKRILQNFATGPDPAARAKKTEIYFSFSEGA